MHHHPYSSCQTHNRSQQAKSNCTWTRRQWLARSAGAIGLLALNDWHSSLNAVEVPKPPNNPGKAQNAQSLPVAIQRCLSYEPSVVRQKIDAALDAIGGIGKLVKNKTVTLKVNMTGPAHTIQGLPASRTYHIHPNIVAALCAALDKAGAQRIAIVEAWYHRESVETILTNAGWDIKAIQSAGGQKVVFENTRNRGSWGNYSRIKVPWGGYLFPAFDLNGWYNHTDVFVSLGKMKDHAVAGVTMTVKNMFGITPTSLYGSDAPNEDTVEARVDTLHDNKRPLPAGVPEQLGPNIPKTVEARVPRIVADLLGARPVDLAIIDGVDTQKNGEGFWNENIKPVQPKLIFAGRNAVCTDAVCAAVMGYQPTAEHFQFPFMGENHLKWAAEAGIGTNDSSKIEVAGLSIKEARFVFRPAPAK